MSEKNRKKGGTAVRRSQMSRQLTTRYILALVGFIIGFFVLLLIGWQICAQFTWRDSDPLYWILRWLRDYAMLWGSVVVLIGWVLITRYYMEKPLVYLDEIIAASEQLAQPDDTPIALSGAMKNVQDELNLVREQALRNAMAAKEAEQRKNDLIVYLAHDLKTPLTSVIGYLTLLRDEPQISPALQARYTDVALNKAERLELLINEFFEITRFSLTHLSLEPEPVDLTRMMEQITYEFNPMLKEKELRWQLSLAPSVVLDCDPDKLERVIDNLLRNAIHYSFPGSEILVSLAEEPAWVTLYVQNSGKTIPAEKLERIFDQFFRLDSARTTSTGGAGLGLAIAKEIVELHGGTIKAQSADERVAFTVRLPKDRKKIV